MNKQQSTILMLNQCYIMEIETDVNYLANSVNLDCVRAERIKGSLTNHIAEEDEHDQQLSKCIKQLGGVQTDFFRGFLDKLPDSKVAEGREPSGFAAPADLRRSANGQVHS